jgi:hypothetical protein
MRRSGGQFSGPSHHIKSEPWRTSSSLHPNLGFRYTQLWDYFTRQVTALLKFAKETTNPELAAILIEKAADLKSQVDELSTTPDPTSQAPDAQPER